jgi:hypothetical protein
MSVAPLDILVIEDNADARDNLRDILELDDHRVATAGSATMRRASPRSSSTAASPTRPPRTSCPASRPPRPTPP